MVEDQVRKAVEKREQEIELPRLTLEDKWEVARGNIIYFVVSGITYAKSKDGSPEEFGTHAGNVAAPFWRTGVGGLRMRTKEETLLPISLKGYLRTINSSKISKWRS